MIGHDRHLAALLCSVLLACACDKLGRTFEETPDAFDTTNDTDDTDDTGALGCGTLYDHDCGADQWCFGPPGCGAPWTCQSESPGCSAAPPFRVCGCDGVITDAAAGCPERHAWGLEPLAGLPGAEAGQRCDASASAPLAWRLELAGTGYSGINDVRLRLRSASDGAPALLRDDDGALAATFREVVFAPGDSHAVEVFGDTDNDGECIDDVDIVGLTYPERLDAVQRVLFYPLTPSELVALRCADLLP